MRMEALTLQSFCNATWYPDHNLWRYRSRQRNFSFAKGVSLRKIPLRQQGACDYTESPNVNAYTQRVKKIIMKSFKLLKPLACLWLLLASCMVTAEGGGLVTTNDDFLPVAEAYQPALMIQDDALIIDWTIAEGYYLYKDKFKLSAKAEDGTALSLAPEYENGKVKYDEYFQKEVETFYHNTQIRIPITGFPKVFEFKMRSQGCADAGLCYAPRSQYFMVDQNTGSFTESKKSNISSTNPLTANGNEPDETSPIIADAEPQSGSLLFYLLLALGGGLILNLMPCVFPVLSLKALSFAQTGGDSAHSHHMHGWAYTAGVVGSFIVVALLIFVARAAGQSAGWGFQLQSPTFVAAMTYLFLIMGLSLSGFVHFGTGLMGVGQSLTNNDGLQGSFFTGVLAAVVASPCTGPMMAPALGFALTQPAIVSITIFIALGFGMALPFLALSYSPKLAQLLPRPGTWMERLKEVLAFPMYMTSAWLLFVFGKQVGMTGVFYLVLGLIAIAFAIWLQKNLPTHPHWRKALQVTVFASLVFAGHVAYKGKEYRELQSEWQPFSKELVQDLREQGQPVFVDFTADWCITCKANESVALSRKGFTEAIKKNNFALVKGDWTNEDPKISAVLEEFGRSGVPLYIVYPADTSQQPEVLPQILTQSIVVAALERAVAR